MLLIITVVKVIEIDKHFHNTTNNPKYIRKKIETIVISRGLHNEQS